MRTLVKFVALTVITLLLLSKHTFAGPLSFTVDGHARRWLNPKVTVRWQPATFGKLDFGNQVMIAFRTWTDLPTVQLDITGQQDDNLAGLTAGELYNQLSRRDPPANITVAIDAGNKVILRLLQQLGDQQPERTIAEMRGYVFEPNATTQFPKPRGFHVMALLVLDSVKQEGDLRRVLLHEAGHALGLGHSSVRVPEVFGIGRPTAPIMTGRIINFELKEDDVAWISSLYPSDRAREIFGAVEGTVSDLEGRGQQGVLVRARLITPDNKYSETHEYSLLTLPADRGSVGGFRFFLPTGFYELTFETADVRFDHGHEDGLKPADRAIVRPGGPMLVHVSANETVRARGYVELWPGTGPRP